MMHLTTYIVLAVSLFGCAHRLPAWAPHPPMVWQCTYMPEYSKFRCTNNLTHVHENRALNDPRMSHAQAVSVEDYNKAQNWVDQFASAAEAHCN